jgi:hypothetical protein
MIVHDGLDDPRWVGAGRTYFPQDLHPDAPTRSSVRVLVEDRTLFLSFQIEGDVNADSADTIWLGLGKGSMAAAQTSEDNDYFLVRASLHGLVFTESNPQQVSDFMAWETGNADLADPGWAQVLNTGWLTALWAWEDPSPNLAWAINLKVDLEWLGLTADEPGRLFLGTFAEVDISNAWVSLWPGSAVSLLDYDVNFEPEDLVPENFGYVSWGSETSACSGGIHLGSDQIGVGPAPDDVVNVFGSADSTDNDYFANPIWPTLVAHPQDAARAHFRIANFAAPPAAQSDAPWAAFSPAPGVSNAADGEFHYTCPVGTAPCAVREPNLAQNQCVLVTLEAGEVEADVLTFSSDSAYRCVHMGEPAMPDAGTAEDGGADLDAATAPDASTTPPDDGAAAPRDADADAHAPRDRSNPTSSDASTTAADLGDAGSSAAKRDEGGCACTVPGIQHGQHDTSTLLAALILAVASLRRRLVRLKKPEEI